MEKQMVSGNYGARETRAERCFSDIKHLAFLTENYGRTQGHKLMVDFGKAMSRFVKELDSGIINPKSYEQLHNLPAILKKQRSWMEHETEKNLYEFDKLATLTLLHGAEILERWEHSTREKLLIVELAYEFYEKFDRNSSGLGELSSSLDNFFDVVESTLDERSIGSEALNHLIAAAEIVLNNVESAGWGSLEESKSFRSKLLTLEVDVLLLALETEGKNYAG
jgi:hypothetical protein